MEGKFTVSKVVEKRKSQKGYPVILVLLRGEKGEEFPCKVFFDVNEGDVIEGSVEEVEYDGNKEKRFHKSRAIRAGNLAKAIIFQTLVNNDPKLLESPSVLIEAVNNWIKLLSS